MYQTQAGMYKEFDQKASPLGPAIGKTINQSAISSTLDMLEKELHGFRESISRLESRLSPVMRPIPSMMSKDSIGDGGSPLCHQLHSYIEMIRSSNSDLQMILECLEL